MLKESSTLAPKRVMFPRRDDHFTNQKRASKKLRQKGRSTV